MPQESSDSSSLANKFLDFSSSFVTPTSHFQASTELFGASPPSSSAAVSTSHGADESHGLSDMGGGTFCSAGGVGSGANLNIDGITSASVGTGLGMEVGAYPMALDTIADFDVSHDMRLATGEENPLAMLPQDMEAWRDILEDLSILTGSGGDRVDS